MRKVIAILFILALGVSLYGFETHKLPEGLVNHENVFSGTRDNRDDIFFDDFEDGDNSDWTSMDMTAPTEAWHLSDVGAYEGNSWWMGDEEIGGYRNHRYIVLDTPELSIPSDGNPVLSFKLNYWAESPGAEDPYDGWDGCNVRISTDGGNTWPVLSGTPAYNCESMYSFGSEFGEGPGVAGWGGSSDGWVDAEMDLSAYAGQDVVIRFAFCSDPGSDTEENGDWFGMKVDDIDVAGMFLSDGDGASGDAQMVPGINMESSGDYWELTTDNQNAGSSYSLHCPVELELLDDMISPVISLPMAGEILLEYMMYCHMADSDGDGDNSLEDYYKVFIRPVEGGSTQLHYLFNSDSGGIPTPAWTLIDQAFVTETLEWQTNATADLTAWAGQDVRLAFQMSTDDNNDGDPTEASIGLFIDDVRVSASGSIYPSCENLTAENTATGVELEWIGPSEESLIDYTHGAAASYINDSQPYAFKFNAEDDGGYVNDINFIFYNAGGTIIGDVEFKVCENDGVIPGTEIFTTRVVPAQYPAVTTVDVSDLGLTLDDDLWVQIGDFQTGGTADGQGLLVDAATNEYNGASYTYNGGAWTAIPDVYNSSNLLISANVLVPHSTYTPTSYSIYRAGTAGGFTTPTYTDISADDYVTSYLDTDVTEGSTYYYVVTGMFDGGESDFSNEVNVTYAVGIENSNKVAYKKTTQLYQNQPNPFNPVTNISFYLNETSDVKLSVYNIRGELVNTLVNGEMEGGRKSVVWNGKDADNNDVSSGIYFYRLETSDFVKTNKMVLLK